MGAQGDRWSGSGSETVGLVCGLRWVGCEHGVELSSIRIWRRVGTSQVSFARGLCESLCLCLPHRTLSKLPLCVSVCKAATLWGQAPQGRGGRSRFPQLLDSKGLFSPACPTSSTPPGSALLTALASAPPHTSTNTFASTLCGSSLLWRWCGKCGSKLSLSIIEFGPGKLKPKETWLMA